MRSTTYTVSAPWAAHADLALRVRLSEPLKTML
jgi:hypothetical protein